MYLRAVHAEFDIAKLQQFIRDNPLGILITAFQSPNFPTIQCTHLPWIFDAGQESNKDDLGKLRGHMARANPHAKALSETAKEAGGENPVLTQEVSVLFNGPAHSYVTPKFYTATKPETGKVVPTWNYSAVQVYGKAKIYYDASNEGASSYLQQQIMDLTKHTEEDIMGFTGGDKLPAWEVDDAPAPYIKMIKKSIIGVEIDIDRLEGKYKMSQEMGAEDREGVIKGFASLETDNGDKMAKTVAERGKLKDRAHM